MRNNYISNHSEIFDLDKSHFQYVVLDRIDPRFKSYTLLNHGLVLNYTTQTHTICFEHHNFIVTIVGLCIDSQGELDREDIASYLAKNCKDVGTFIEKLGRFAGKYILIFQDQYKTYAFTDATSSLPIYYSVDTGFFSSSEHLLASSLVLEKNSLAIKINSQAIPNLNLPFNITHYNRLLFLLPNHFLDVNERSYHRYFVPSYYLSNLSAKDNAAHSLKLIKNIVNEYSKYYELISPLTAGNDSRVVLSFLSQEKSIEPICYTLDYDFTNNNKESAEIKLPRKICQDFNIHYEKLAVLSTPETLLSKAYEIIGNNNINIQRINIAYTLHSKYPNKALVYGDIIDQIGRSNIFPSDSAPDILSKFDKFFISKNKSFSLENAQLTKEYLSYLRSTVQEKHIFDFFALEMRCGRWLSQYSEVNSSLGVNILNIFNNSDILMSWINTDRTIRSKKFFHKYYLNHLCPELANYPVNPHENNSKIRKIKTFNILGRYLAFNYRKVKTRYLK